MQTNRSLSVWIEGALIIALGYLLSFIKINLSPYFGVSLGSIPLILYALRNGWRPGLIIGLAYGVFKIILGQAIFLSFVQGMIEYTLPYASLGLAGIFAPKLRQVVQEGQNKKLFAYVTLSSFVALGVRYFWHFLAGVVYWAEYAPEGMNAWIYSLLVNGGNMLGSWLAASLILYFLIAQSKQIILSKSLS